jgi:hypothetical protein
MGTPESSPVRSKKPRGISNSSGSFVDFTRELPLKENIFSTGLAASEVVSIVSSTVDSVVADVVLSVTVTEVFVVDSAVVLEVGAAVGAAVGLGVGVAAAAAFSVIFTLADAPLTEITSVPTVRRERENVEF